MSPSGVNRSVLVILIGASAHDRVARMDLDNCVDWIERLGPLRVAESQCGPFFAAAVHFVGRVDQAARVSVHTIREHVKCSSRVFARKARAVTL